MTLKKSRWLLTVPLILGASLASGSEIKDRAGLFSEGAVRQAKADLDRLEQATKVTTLIETVDSLNGKTIANASMERAQASGINGIYVLISKAEHKLEARDSKRFLGEPGRRSIVDAFTTGFKAGKFDDGLAQGVQAIESAVADSGGLSRGGGAAVPPGPVRGRGRAMPGRVPPGGGSSGLGILVMIGVVILAVLIGMRLLGRLFGGGQGRQAGPPQMGGRGYGAPGYGAPGYGGGGGRGGGFFSGLLGGLGGAVAGNWLYDQFGNRHSGGTPTDSGGLQSGDPGSGGGDWGGTSGDWGGGDAGGGGDWGGGDAGGGGDWGGGGGDGGSW
ncbi:MAG: TPM domain-containing protein [Isosphaeraceae bacterium]